MMNRIDCDVRVTTHARQIARVNATEWMRPPHAHSTRIPLRSRLGSVLIVLGTRLTPASAGASVVPLFLETERLP